MTDRVVSVERTIAAPPQLLFDLLADHRMHPVLDGSGTVRGGLAGPDRLSLGATFGMRMRVGVPYPIRNTVVEFEEGRLIAWRHFAGHRWRYELEPAGDGTRVVESFDWSTSLWPKVIELLQYPQKHPEGMRRTLENLEREALTRLAEVEGDVSG